MDNGLMRIWVALQKQWDETGPDYEMEIQGVEVFAVYASEEAALAAQKEKDGGYYDELEIVGPFDVQF